MSLNISEMFSISITLENIPSAYSPPCLFFKLKSWPRFIVFSLFEIISLLHNESPELWQEATRIPPPPILHSLASALNRSGKTQGENGFFSYRKSLVRCCKFRQMCLISQVRKLFFSHGSSSQRNLLWHFQG